MHCKSLLLLLLLGAAYSASDQARQETSITLLNPKQIRHAEKAITNFLSRFAGPVGRPIILRDTTSEPRNIQSAIEEIANAVRRNLMEFAKACGLTRSVRQYEKTIVNSTSSDDWLMEGLLQGSLVFSDLLRMWDETSSRVERYFRTHNVRLQPAQVSSSSDGLGFLESLNDGCDYCSRIPKCLETRSSDEILKGLNQILPITKSSPRITIELLQSRLDMAFRNVSENSMQLNTFFCRSLARDSRSYENCCRSFMRLDKCVCGDTRRKGNKVASKNTVPETWIRKVEDISDCKVRTGKDGAARVKCQNEKMPRGSGRQVKFIYERLLSRKLNKKSPLSRMARDFGKVLEKSPWARKCVDEICQFLWIYDEGNRRARKLEKIAGKNAKATARYRKLAGSLLLYKDGLLRKTFASIGNMHRSSTALEKLLIQGLKNVFNETWQGHTRILSSMTDWMMNLFELVGSNGLGQEGGAGIPLPTELPVVASTVSNQPDGSFAWESDEDFKRKESNLIQTAIATSAKSQREMQKAADQSFKKFMGALSRAKTRKLSGRSTLAGLANNLLLVTMFMETLGFVSTLFSFGQHNHDEPGSLDMMSTWHGAQKRSLEIRDLQHEASRNILEDPTIVTNNVEWTFIQYDEGYVPSLKNENTTLDRQSSEQNFI